MTVLYVTHYSALFGANRALIEIIEEGKKNGISPVVISLLDGRLVTEMKKRDVPCYVVKGYPWTTKKNSPQYVRIMKQVRNQVVNKIAANKIMQICKKHKVDVVHTNSSVVNIGAEAAFKLGIPHIWHLREFGDADYNLEFYCGKKKAVKYIEAHSHKIISISNVIYQHYSTHADNRKKWVTVYDGVDSGNYLLDKRQPQKALSIAFMGVLQENKNQLELLKALKLFYLRNKTKDFEVFFMGGGSDVYAEKLKEYAKNGNISECVHFVGNVDDVREYLSRCNIGVTASKMEAFGRVTIEYMYAGLCVVASSSGANTEIITPGCAILYESGNESDLCDRLTELYKNPDLLHQTAVNGKNMALSLYSAEQNMRNIMEVYKSL